MNEKKMCDLCGVEQDAHSQAGNFIDYGWSFNWLHLGHYGGFTDNFPPSPNKGYDSARHTVHMCHDCITKMLQLFPRLSEIAKLRGGHPNRNKDDGQNGIAVPPCCQYCWTWVINPDSTSYEDKYITYFATPQLTWER